MPDAPKGSYLRGHLSLFFPSPIGPQTVAWLAHLLKRRFTKPHWPQVSDLVIKTKWWKSKGVISTSTHIAQRIFTPLCVFIMHTHAFIYMYSFEMHVHMLIYRWSIFQLNTSHKQFHLPQDAFNSIFTDLLLKSSTQVHQSTWKEIKLLGKGNDAWQLINRKGGFGWSKTLADGAKILQITRAALLESPTDGEENKPGCYISWLLSTTWR